MPSSWMILSQCLYGAELSLLESFAPEKYKPRHSSYNDYSE